MVELACKKILESSYNNLLLFNTYEEPEFVFSECISFFKESLKIACDEITNYDSNNYLMFGPIIREIKDYITYNQDYETKDFYRFYHYFFVLLKVNKEIFDSHFIYLLNQNKNFFCQIKSMNYYKFKKYKFWIYQIIFETDEIQWGAFIFLNDNTKNPLFDSFHMLVLNYRLSCFSGNQIIFYRNNFIHVDICKNNFKKINFPFEFFELRKQRTGFKTDTYIYRNKFFILYENIHKKFIQENKNIKQENTNCIICDFNSPIICNLQCCQQEICLNCISRMFLSNLVCLNADFLLFVPCPFCRRSMTWESYSLKCENEEHF